MMVIYLLITFAIGCIFCQGFTNPSVANLQIKAIGYRPLQAASFPELERCLFREYTSFFAPMEKKFYKPDVAFVDPLTSLLGIEAYQKNVDTLAGRTMLGNVLFKDAGIVLHNIVQLSEKQLQTRWTLQVTVKAIPWKPRAKFTGVSIYTVDDNGIVIKQEDFWDSINLNGGKYESVSLGDGVKDFLGQLNQEQGAEMAAPELPYELLRRGKRYDVRRYPATLTAETSYDQRPEGYDRLGSYAGGSNVADKRVQFYSPTIMRIQDTAATDGKLVRTKRMTWPLNFAMPGRPAPGPETVPEPTIGRVALGNKPSMVVAVLRFELAATEPIVRGFTKELLRDIKADGMAASDEVAAGLCTVAQYDALFSLNKRRNEVWVELVDHPWL